MTKHAKKRKHKPYTKHTVFKPVVHDKCKMKFKTLCKKQRQQQTTQNYATLHLGIYLLL